MYVRPLDLTWKQKNPDLANRWAGLMSALNAWLSTSDRLVINRPLAGAHNSSKPLHEELISRCGLRVPLSLSTTDMERIRAFMAARPSVVKSLGGDRGDTAILTERMLPATARLSAPIHVQEYKPGHDVRVHVIRRRVYSLLIESDAVDYRAPGAQATYMAFSLPAEIEEGVIEATASFGLEFAGWDFKLGRDGVYWCLEANPQPGYSSYDGALGLGISSALLDLMAAYDRLAQNRGNLETLHRLS
jgi:glutathione synthase/RimK-type ligase-like ATP-grasp enzyme